MQILELLEHIYNSYLNLVILTIAFYLLIEAGKDLISKYLHNLTKKTKGFKFDDEIIESVAKLPNYLILLLSLKITSKFFADLPLETDNILNSAILIALIIEIAKISNRIIDAVYKDITSNKTEKIDTTLLILIKRLVKISVWVLLALMTLQNLGFNVSTLIAGLGIGGIAVAFALQNILSDIFASFSIFFDKPFEIDDYIVVGQNKGVVKHIGIKTTRITSLEGQEVVIPNKELTETVVENYGRIKNRRVSLKIGVEYSISNEKLKKAIKIITEAIKAEKQVDKIDWVVFKSFGDSALIIEAVYYLTDFNYLTYLATQEKINFAIKQGFEKESIEFAYPSQTIYLKNSN